MLNMVVLIGSARECLTGYAVRSDLFGYTTFFAFMSFKLGSEDNLRETDILLPFYMLLFC